MPRGNEKIDLDAEDALIERQLKEAQERISFLKAQVAKERKLRLQIKKKNNAAVSKGEKGEEDIKNAVQSSLEASLLTTGSAASLPGGDHPTLSSVEQTGLRPSTSDGGTRFPSSTHSGGMITSQSQPALSTKSGRPQTAGFGSGSGISAARSLSSSNKKERRPRTAKSKQASSLARLSPQRARPSDRHRNMAQDMSYKRLKELMSDKLFQEAIKRKGVHARQLLPRPMETFRRQENRAALLPIEVAQLNFEEYVFLQFFYNVFFFTSFSLRCIHNNVFISI